jgi:hypothetical protein
MKRKLLIIAGALVAIGAAAAGALYWAFPVRVSILAGLTRNYILSWSAPRGTATTEDDPLRGPIGATPLNAASWQNAPGIPISGGGTWTSYTLDIKTGLLYVPGLNPAPDFVIGAREGLYQVGRRARRQDGKLQTPFQDRAEGLA